MAEDMLTTLIRWACPLILSKARLPRRYPFFGALTRIAFSTTEWAVSELALVDALYMLCVQRALLRMIWLQGSEDKIYEGSARCTALRRDWVEALSNEIYDVMRATIIGVIDEGDAGERHKGFAPTIKRPQIIPTAEANNALPFDMAYWKFVRRNVPRCPDDALRHDAYLTPILPDIQSFVERCIIRMGAQMDSTGSARARASSLIYKALSASTAAREATKGKCSCLEKAWLAAHLARQFAIMRCWFLGGRGELVSMFATHPDICEAAVATDATLDLVARLFAPAKNVQMAMTTCFERRGMDNAATKMYGDAPHSEHTMIEFDISFRRVEIERGGARRLKFDDPHIFAFLTHGANAVHPFSKGTTRLENMYALARGQMRAVARADRGVLHYQLHSLFDRETLVAKNVMVYFVIYYRVASPLSYCDEYEVGPQCRVPVADLEIQRNYSALEGPSTGSKSFSSDYTTTKPFEYDVGAIIRVIPSSQREQTPAKEPSIETLTSEDDERTRNMFYDRALSDVRANTLPSERGPPGNQTLAFMGYPGFNLDILAAVHLTPQEIPVWKYEQMLARALRAKGFTGTQFTTFCKRLLATPDNAAEWEFEIFRQIVCVALNMFNALVYRDDTVSGREGDHMQSQRLTGNGDCEDSGQGIFEALRYLIQLEGPMTSQLSSLQEILTKNYVPGYTTMYVALDGSPMHCVASLVPRHRFHSGHATISPFWRLILLEGTNPNESNVRAFDKTLCSDPAAAAAAAVGATVETANEVYRAITDVVKKERVAQGGAVQNKWHAARPPSEYRGDFYIGFISVCCASPDYSDGPEGAAAVYYRFRGPDDVKMNVTGAPLADVLCRNEYSLAPPPELTPDDIVRVSRANKFVRDLTLHVPLFDDAHPNERAPPQATVDLFNTIRGLCHAHSTTDAALISGGLTDAEVESGAIPLHSVIMTYNPCTAPAGSNLHEIADQFGKIIAHEDFARNVSTLEAELIEMWPLIYIISVTAFFKRQNK